MLSYASQQYAECMSMGLDVTYIPYATYSREQTGDIIMSAHFEDGDLLSETRNLLSETRDDTESGNKSDDNSNPPPLIIEEEMYVMSSGHESDDQPMSTDMVEDICDGIQSHRIKNRRETRYKIRDHIK